MIINELIYRTSLISLSAQNYKQIFENTLDNALNGNCYEQYRLGWLYAHGQGTDKNEEEAFTWFMKAAEHGLAEAQYAVGTFFYNGQVTNKDINIAFDWFIKAALQNYALAQYNVGMCYKSGYGVEKDDSLSFKWCKKAAEQNLADAQYQVALSYEYGQGIEKNERKSFDWFMKAAKQGHVLALNTLAHCYMEGKGVIQNKNKAWECLNGVLKLYPHVPILLDSKGEFYSMDDNVQKALDTWNEINKISSTFYIENGETNFSRYIRGLNGDNIDLNIPTTMTENKNTYAIIIANENYQDVSTVPFAINDGNLFSEYCKKTLGIPDANIHLVKNATLNNIRREMNWLKQVLSAYGDEANVIFYYAGHGIPDETGVTSYILPIDGIGNDVSTGYNLQDLYSTLGSLPAKRTTVFLDACFSGVNRDGSMLASARGVAIKARQSTPTGNLVVFSAAQGDETAWPYKEKQHGLFTYYLLKKIKDSNGDVSLGELSDFVCSEVKKQSIISNKKSQTPIIGASASIDNDWKSWTLK